MILVLNFYEKFENFGSEPIFENPIITGFLDI